MAEDDKWLLAQRLGEGVDERADELADRGAKKSAKISADVDPASDFESGNFQPRGGA